jgi:hypothetical protein
VNRRDFVILLGLAVLVLAFVAWELGGLTAGLPIHTISWYSQHNAPLAIGIGVAFPAAGIAGLAWWIWHMHSRIPK